MPADSRPVVVHVMYRFDTGGLENGVVNLINHMPADLYRHVILALTDVTDFKLRIRRDDVEFIALQKPPGHSVWQFPKLYRLFKRLRPAIVHSRNRAALEAQIPAWAAGVPLRIHGEHGRDVGDLDGNNRTYQRVRRLYRPFVHHYVALSRDLSDYLIEKINVSRDRITQAYNGVDVSRFSPAGDASQGIGSPFNTAEHFIVGTVGRMQTVKDQTLLAHAFVLALQTAPELKTRLRLVMVGDGPLRAEAQAILDAAGVAHLTWLPGARDDVAALMQGFSCFVLPSLAEGISNTILEAMASGLPVIATGVGGNADLVADGVTGQIVPASDPQTMAQSLIQFVSSAAQSRAMGLAGRERVVQRFSMQAMVNTYQRVYDEQLRRRRGP